MNQQLVFNNINTVVREILEEERFEDELFKKKFQIIFGVKSPIKYRSKI